MQKGNCMITIQKVVKWVNLLAANIPNTITEQCGVQEGSAVKLKIKSNIRKWIGVLRKVKSCGSGENIPVMNLF